MRSNYESTSKLRTILHHFDQSFVRTFLEMDKSVKVNYNFAEIRAQLYRTPLHLKGIYFILYGTARYGMVWYGIAWHGMAWWWKVYAACHRN